MPEKKLRLRDLDPVEVATEAHARVVASMSSLAEATGARAAVKAADSSTSAVFIAVLGVAHFAVSGDGGGQVEKHLRSLEKWFSLEELFQPEPSTPLALAVAGAIALKRLLDGESLAATNLAVLTGLDRDHVTRLAAAEQIPSAYRSNETRHMPWKFRPSQKLRAWIEAHNMESDEDGTASP